MFHTHRLAFTSATLLLIAPHAAAAQYSFVNIVDERSQIGFRFAPQAVSDTGTVAFIGVAGTYLGSGGAVQQVVPNLDPPAGFSGFGDWALNASGVAAGVFECCNPRHDKIQLYEASGSRTIGQVMGGATFDAGFGEPVINNTGAVASMDKNNLTDEDLLRFRAEAAELLGITEPALSTISAPKP